MERFKVTFTYTEPMYARARGIAEHCYLGFFEVTASDPEGAVAIATELFHEAQRRSGVSWAREIKQTTWRILPSEVRVSPTP